MGGVPAGFRVRAEKGGGHCACEGKDMQASSRQEERGPLYVLVHCWGSISSRKYNQSVRWFRFALPALPLDLGRMGARP